jgi:hypothetical protein
MIETLILMIDQAEAFVGHIIGFLRTEDNNKNQLQLFSLLSQPHAFELDIFRTYKYIYSMYIYTHDPLCLFFQCINSKMQLSCIFVTNVL